LASDQEFQKERLVMSEMEATRSRRARSEDGFALVLAILALMLLTFLGLTMAATSSTELQIATNYRWSQQALYNAEAGLEASKVILAAPGVQDWLAALPNIRGGNWAFGAAPPPSPAAADPRDYERSGPTCSDRAGVGYGKVLVMGGVTYSNVTTFSGQNLNGAFTLWIRRPVTVDSATGKFADSVDNTAAVITAEGVAPYGGTFANAAVTTFTRANQATRILETSLGLVTTQSGKRCQGLAGQEGLAASGENFDPCSPMNASSVGAALGLGTANETVNK